MEAKVLVVEHEPETLGFIQGHLAARGFKAIPARSSEQVLEAIERERLKIVFVDIDSPDLDGLDLIREIKRIDGTVQVIALTASSSLVNAVRAFRLGASDYILNPSRNPERIDHAVWLCLEKFKWWSDIFQEVSREKEKTAGSPDRAG